MKSDAIDTAGQHWHINLDFDSYLNNQLSQTEYLRSNIIIVTFTILLGAMILFNIVYPTGLAISEGPNFTLILICFYLAIIVYELILRKMIRKTIERKNRIRLHIIRYGNAFEEVSLPTIGILILGHFLDRHEMLTGPMSYFYFIFIVLAALRLNFRLSVYTGLVAAVEYFGLSLFYTHFAVPPVILTPFGVLSALPKCAVMLFCGIIIGIISLEIRCRIRHSFQAIQDQNCHLEELVKERTAELETLNRNLEAQVEKEVKKRRKNEQLLIQQSKMSAMGELIGMIAHQWRQPLASIGAITGNLSVQNELGVLEKDQIDLMIREISEQTQYLSTTITDFRSFLSTTKKRELSLLSDIIEKSLKIIGKSLENKNIAVVKDINFTQPIRTYPNELVQVIINILKNAQDVCLERQIQTPKIFINGRQNEQYQTLSIEDNAGGIPDEIAGKVFDPYFTTKTDQDGTGLGLYMSKTIIETHCKGSLEVINTEIGARFNITLPVTDF